VKSNSVARWPWRLGMLALAGTLLTLVSGCPIDRNTVVTETTRAALQATIDSLVASLSQFLAGN
jgi:hypothetical protein